MNPTAATHPRTPAAMAAGARRPVGSGPARQPLAAPVQTAAGDTPTNIVNNIPMHTPAPVAATNEDDELETIMKDIGHELKQADRKATEKHISLFGRKHHAPAPKPAQPPTSAATVAVPAPQPPPPAQSVRPATATPTPVPKPTKSHSAPIGVISITILVTGVLIAAAIYTYK
jgi:hypothetical protein